MPKSACVNATHYMGGRSITAREKELGVYDFVHTPKVVSVPDEGERVCDTLCRKSLAHTVF